MKVNRLIEKSLLTESGKSAGDFFELGAAEWLNNNFGDTGYTFKAKQDTGHGDIECIYNDEVKFLVECKLGSAQAGQMSLKAIKNDDGTEVIEYDYTRDNNTTLGKLTSQILNLVNKSFKASGQPISTAGLNIENIEVDSEGDIGVEAIIDENNQLFQRFVKQEYLDNKPSTKFFIFDKKQTGLSNEDYALASNIDPHLCLTSNIDKVYKMTAKVRLKIDADSLKYSSIDNHLKNELKKGFNADDIIDINGEAYALLPDRVNANGEYITTVDGVTYHLNVKKAGTIDVEGKPAQQIRKRKEPRTIFIITLSLTKEGYNINQVDEFKAYLENAKKSKNEELDMRKKLSEELVIDEPNSGEELKPELEKVAEERKEEVQKELQDRVDMVEDEINNAKTPEIEIKDVNDKKVKIKQFTEKLILEEPSEILTEDWEDWDADDYMERYFNAVSKVHLVLVDFINECKDYMHEVGELQYDAAESVCEEALFHLKDEIDEFGNLSEEVLDEKIPSDLAKAYKRVSYTGAGNADLQNAEYNEVSADDGYRIYKQDPSSIRLLIDGRLIDFRPNGYASINHRDEWLPNELAYTNKKGKVIRDTLRVPAKHLFNIASKVYVTNEHKPEGQKDAELLTKRAENPESPRYAGPRYDRDITGDWYHDNIRGSRGRAYRDWEIQDAEERVKEYQDRLKNSANLEPDEIAQLQSYLDRYKNKLARYRGDNSDLKAYKRYISSQNKLREPFVRYNELKSNINDLEYKLERSETKLNDARENGSPEVARKKRDLDDYNRRLKELKKEIAYLEMELLNADEDNAAAIAELETEFNKLNSKNNEYLSELNTLLRRS